eukprot:gene19592-25495_t
MDLHTYPYAVAKAAIMHVLGELVTEHRLVTESLVIITGDNYPKGNDRMEAPRRGNGHDFNPNSEYRMYHGDLVPGNAGRYGIGDLQWMTAGKGIVHGENFPLIYNDKPNPLRLFQIWLNLPSKHKMVDPDFVMHWKEEIPVYKSNDSRTKVIIWAGEYDNIKALKPTTNSWANDEYNEVTIYHIIIQPTGEFALPPAKYGKDINRMLYFIEGSSMTIQSDEKDKQIVTEHIALTLNSSKSAVITNNHSSITVELLFLQGRPIAEPVAQHGPFVMNTNREIQQAFADYKVKVDLH